MKSARVLVSLAALALLLSAAPQDIEDSTLRLSYGNDPDTINYITANDTVSGDFQRWVYEPLADRDFADPDKWIPTLAEKWDFDEKNLEWTAHLRKGVKWHPMNLPGGEALPEKEFTSADVKFTFDCILNKHVAAAALRSYYEDPDAKEESEKYKIKVTVVDDYTVKFKWTKPYFQAFEFTFGIGIIPEHVYSVDDEGFPISMDYDSEEFAEGFNTHWANSGMCGTGQMILEEWKREDRLVLKRNEKYWGKPFPFKKVIFRNISNPNTRLQKLLQNELDWSRIAEKDHYIQSKKHDNVESGKVRLCEYKYPAYRYMGYNQKRELFKDAKVRWALGHAVPIDEIINNVYHGLAARLTGPFLPDSSANNRALKPVSYDLEKSRKLLEEAGWKDTDENGIRDKVINGTKLQAEFDLMIYADSPQYKTIAEIIKENFRKIGVKVLISPVKWGLMLQKLRKKEFDATILGWALGWKSDPFQIWHGSQADLPESSNSIGYRNAELDKLIEELRITFSQKRQIEIYHQIHEIIYNDQPYTFLFMDKATSGYHSRIRNVNFYQIRPCVDMREWAFSGTGGSDK